MNAEVPVIRVVLNGQAESRRQGRCDASWFVISFAYRHVISLCFRDMPRANIHLHDNPCLTTEKPSYPR